MSQPGTSYADDAWSFVHRFFAWTHTALIAAPCIVILFLVAIAGREALALGRWPVPNQDPAPPFLQGDVAGILVVLFLLAGLLAFWLGALLSLVLGPWSLVASIRRGRHWRDPWYLARVLVLIAIAVVLRTSMNSTLQWVLNWYD